MCKFSRGPRLFLIRLGVCEVFPDRIGVVENFYCEKFTPHADTLVSCIIVVTTINFLAFFLENRTSDQHRIFRLRVTYATVIQETRVIMDRPPILCRTKYVHNKFKKQISHTHTIHWHSFQQHFLSLNFTTAW